MKSFTKQNVLHLTPDVVHLQMTVHQSATKMFLSMVIFSKIITTVSVWLLLASSIPHCSFGDVV